MTSSTQPLSRGAVFFGGRGDRQAREQPRGCSVCADRLASSMRSVIVRKAEGNEVTGQVSVALRHIVFVRAVRY